MINNDNDDLLNREIFICKCHSLEHQVSFWYDEEDNFLYCEPHLTTNRNFFQRLFYGLKYAFGFKSRYGAWDEFLFKNKDLLTLKEYIDKIIENEKTRSN